MAAMSNSLTLDFIAPNSPLNTVSLVAGCRDVIKVLLGINESMLQGLSISILDNASQDKVSWITANPSALYAYNARYLAVCKAAHTGGLIYESNEHWEHFSDRPHDVLWLMSFIFEQGRWDAFFGLSLLIAAAEMLGRDWLEETSARYLPRDSADAGTRIKTIYACRVVKNLPPIEAMEQFRRNLVAAKA
jgi:hypothetical protein